MNSESALRSALDRIKILEELETPAVVVDRPALQSNIDAGAAIARSARAKLRPHVKSHKSVEIARMQVAAGATGLTVAKSSEAMIFLEAGFGDITVAHPLVDSRKIARLLQAAATRNANLTFIVDSETGIGAIGGEAARLDRKAAVQLKVDVGLHRCGVAPEGHKAARLASLIVADPALQFAGIISHAGHAYSAPTPEAVTATARHEQETMMAVADGIRRAGIAVPAISVGSTPTVWLGDRFEGISELRPGNYVFMDLTQVSLGVAMRDNIALSVLATVVSCNERYAIIDAGSRVLSSDRGPHGSTRLAGYGVALRLREPGAPDMSVVSLSEEHGFVAHLGGQLTVGERLRILPNHACAVVNLARNLAVTNKNDIEVWPVDAQACVS